MNDDIKNFSPQNVPKECPACKSKNIGVPILVSGAIGKGLYCRDCGFVGEPALPYLSCGYVEPVKER